MTGSPWIERKHTPWSDERVAKLKELAARGLSGTQIGGILLCSRNAVIGKLSRLGAPLVGDRPKLGRPFRNPKPKLVAATAQAAKGPGDAARQSCHPRRSATPAPPPLMVMPVTLAECQGWEGIAAAVVALDRGMCCWPLGALQEPPTGFCRAPVAILGKPYCEHHAYISRYGDPSARKSALSHEQQRRIILDKLVHRHRTHTADVAENLGCTVEDAINAIARTRAWLQKQGIRVTSAQAAGYWICPADKHLAIALLRQVGGS